LFLRGGDCKTARWGLGVSDTVLLHFVMGEGVGWFDLDILGRWKEGKTSTALFKSCEREGKKIKDVCFFVD